MQCAAIHGDISQAQRTAAVEAFKAGTTPLLIATDVAARGLDIPDVEVSKGWVGADTYFLLGVASICVSSTSRVKISGRGA
jgi:late competence protein required for DNA uptake (superfamily II DNA/RNA helicase)